MNELIMRDVLASIPVGVCVLDTDGRITFWNQAAERLAGHRADDITGRRCCDGVLVHLDENGHELCGPEGCTSSCLMTQHRSRETAVALRHRIGHRVRSTTRSIPIVDDDGGHVATALFFDAPSGRSILEMEFENLKELALLDPVTHIGNRRYGERAITVTLAERERLSGTFGVLFADIDDFKSVNDTHGHSSGDKVLRMVARTLAKGIRLYDVVCRWGGDEFLMMLQHVTPEQLGARAESLRRLLRHSFVGVGSERIGITVSIGATMYRTDDDDQVLVDRADWLMYRSKHAGGNRVTFG